MPTPVVIPQDYLTFIAIIATGISHIIRQLNLSKMENTVTSAIAIAIIIFVTAWETAGFTPDLRADALLLCSVTLSLLSGGKELVDLLNLLYGVQLTLKRPRVVRVPDVPMVPGIPHRASRKK